MGGPAAHSSKNSQGRSNVNIQLVGQMNNKPSSDGPTPFVETRSDKTRSNIRKFIFSTWGMLLSPVRRGFDWIYTKPPLYVNFATGTRNFFVDVVNSNTIMEENHS